MAHEAKEKGRSRSTRQTGRVCIISPRTEAEEAHDKALLDQKQDATPVREMAEALRQGEARLRRSQRRAARGVGLGSSRRTRVRRRASTRFRQLQSLEDDEEEASGVERGRLLA